MPAGGLTDCVAQPVPEAETVILAQLDRSGDGVAWQEIVSKPRGETGQAMLEVLKTFGSSADPLRSAVAADYQQEADAALLGFEFDVAHKA